MSTPNVSAPPGPALYPADHRRRRWWLLLIGTSAGMAVWAGWVGLGNLVGFGIVHPLPGIADGLTLNTAITLPIGVEAYAMYALSVATTTATITRAARRFAWISSVVALILGMVGQVAYHLMTANHITTAPWPIVAGVSCLPVLVLGVASVLWHLAGQTPTPTTATGLDTDTGSAAAVTDAAQDAAPDLVQPDPVTPETATVPGRPTPRRTRRTPGPASSRAASRTTSSRTPTAERVARALAKTPTASPAQIAARLEVSERTVQRYWPHPGEPDTTRPNIPGPDAPDTGAAPDALDPTTARTPDTESALSVVA